jgi:hypothetical protein
MTMGPGQKRRITLVQSDDPPEAVRKAMPDKNLVEVELYVRKPDKVDTEDFAVAARLCSCRQVCLAFIDPD